ERAENALDVVAGGAEPLGATAADLAAAQFEYTVNDIFEGAAVAGLHFEKQLRLVGRAGADLLGDAINDGAHRRAHLEAVGNAGIAVGIDGLGAGSIVARVAGIDALGR